MTADLLLAATGFVLVTSATPGPNNAMLLASGVNFGFRRTLPHMLGVSAGCALMFVLVGIGLGQAFAAAPLLYQALRYGGALYLLWLAWHIAVARGIHPSGTGPRGTAPAERRGRPMRFIEGLLFQWINPKAWVMVIGAVTAYVPHQHFLVNVITLSLIFVAVGLPCIAVWAGFGVALRRFLDSPIRMRAFNWGMAALLVASLYPLLEG
jgi:threonine/homoserine/homoserine lactone efflux protein